MAYGPSSLSRIERPTPRTASAVAGFALRVGRPTNLSRTYLHGGGLDDPSRDKRNCDAHDDDRYCKWKFARRVDEVDGVVAGVAVAVCLTQVGELAEWVLLGPTAGIGVAVALAELDQAVGGGRGQVAGGGWRPVARVKVRAQLPLVRDAS
jgi:hypothetical protein